MPIDIPANTTLYTLTGQATWRYAERFADGRLVGIPAPPPWRAKLGSSRFTFQLQYADVM
jgi:hypothetical protein